MDDPHAVPGDSSEPPQLFVPRRAARLASLDVFRGLSVFLMMLVDYGGSVFPIIAHCPWNGLHLADFVMPFFLFIAGVSLALVYKRGPQKGEATWKAVLRAVKLFFLGILLQGGYFHGITSLTYGVDVEKIRWMGILQRISFGYIVAALCEIWLPGRRWKEIGFFRSYYRHWFIVALLLAIYSGLLYGLYVPDWQFELSALTSSPHPLNDANIYTLRVNCSVRGDLGPACNSAGMIDRYILGLDHLYRKPVYRNLKECKMSASDQVSNSSPSWCLAPFDPEGLLSSLTAAVSCIIGLQYGHVLARLQDHNGRLKIWMWFSVSFLALGLFIAQIGIPVNKSLYTASYMLVTSAVSGITFSTLYLLVDVHGYRRWARALEWMGKHSLSIFVIVSSNLAVIVVEGFYLSIPENNLVSYWCLMLCTAKRVPINLYLIPEKLRLIYRTGPLDSDTLCPKVTLSHSESIYSWTRLHHGHIASCKEQRPEGRKEALLLQLASFQKDHRYFPKRGKERSSRRSACFLISVASSL